MTINSKSFPILALLPQAPDIKNLGTKWRDDLCAAFAERSGVVRLIDTEISIRDGVISVKNSESDFTISGIEYRHHGQPADVDLVSVMPILKQDKYNDFNSKFTFKSGQTHVSLHSLGSFMPLSSNLEEGNGVYVDGGNNNFFIGVGCMKFVVPIEMICVAACRYLTPESANKFIGGYLESTIAEDVADHARAPDVYDSVAKVMSLTGVEPLAVDHPYLQRVQEFAGNPNPFLGQDNRAAEEVVKASLRTRVESGGMFIGRSESSAQQLLQALDNAHAKGNTLPSKGRG